LINIDGLSSLSSVSVDVDINRNNILANIDGLSALTLVGNDLSIDYNGGLVSIGGLSSLISVGGSMIISNNDSLGDVYGLSNLTQVGSYLAISENASLTSVNGFPAVERWEGSISINSNPALVDISALSQLVSVGDALSVWNNRLLADLNGLSSLNSVGGDLGITRNDSLTSLAGLSSLAYVGGNLRVEENPGLINLDGLSSLSEIGGSITISDNQGLIGIDALAALTDIGADLRITSNNELTAIDGLADLTNIRGTLSLGGNKLADIGGLSEITYVEGSLLVKQTALTSLDAFSGLTSVGETLYVSGNSALTNINGLSGLAYIGQGLQIGDNDVLASIDGLSAITQATGSVEISGNRSLSSVRGLSSLLSVGRYLYVAGNDALVDLDGLQKLTSVAENLIIRNNAGLVDLDALSALKQIGGLEIVNNDSLLNIKGLEALEILEISNVWLSENDKLSSLDGFPPVTTTADLYIEFNAILTNVDALSFLSRVDGYVQISGNPALTDVDGLLSLTYAWAGVYVEYNPSLKECMGLIPLLDGIDDGEPGPDPATSEIPDVGSLVLVRGNSQGCNSLEEVLASEISTAFLVNKTHSDLNPASVKISLGCDHPTTLVSIIDDQASAASPAEFRVHRFIPGFQANCTAAEVTVPFGYSVNESNCQDISLGFDANSSCEIINTQNPVRVFVNTLFRDGSNASVLVELNCSSGTVTADNPNSSMSDPAGFTVTGFPFDGTTCSATGNLPEGYFLESSTCSSMTISPGRGDSCTLINDIDSDADGILESNDNCPLIANPDQSDADDDGIGDACEQNIIEQQSQVVKAFETSGELEGDCRGVAEINGVLLAQIYTDEYGCELWKLDDEQGHSLFADINPGPPESLISSNFGYYEPYNGWIYFGAYNGVDNKRMWRTDGQVAEMVEETDEVPGGFTSIPTNRADFNGLYYFLASSTADQTRLYSLDGEAIRPEPQMPLEANGRVYRVSTLFDKLVMTIQDDEHGAEPWVFDGTEFRILQDIIPGPESALTPGHRWTYVDESWVFSARYRLAAGNYQPAYFYTDGVTVEKLPHSGPWMEPITRSGSIYTSNATYGVDVYYPGNGDTGLPVLRIGKESTSSYKLPLDLSRPSDASMAILGGDVLVLNHNRLFKLGETSAVELPFSLPTDWQDPVFRFVGSGDYFRHAYIEETGENGVTRVWVWNFTGAGLMMAGEDNVVTHAEYFRHIGNDIYFYGEDEQTGMALRRVTDVVIKPVPRLGAVTGSWYDPATSGQGFVLHPIDDNYTVISFYGFEDNGKPLWLTGVGQDLLKTGYTTEIQMNITSGGNFGSFTPDQISEQPWGTLRITFDTCSKATAEFGGLSGAQTMNMVRLAGLEGINCYYSTPPSPESAGLTGSWYDPATSGQGLVLHPVNDQQMIVSFYGYKNDSERLWLIGAYNGEVVKGESLVIDMIAASGGNFGEFTPEDITESAWGTLTINFAGCENATATLDGVDGQQTMNMVKLAGLQGSALNCQ
jgi:ELWxxDGT repeat protein